MVAPMRTYSTMGGSAGRFLVDARRLYQTRKHSMDFEVRSAVSNYRSIERMYQALTNRPLRDESVLIVGAGQTPREIVTFGTTNKVTAIDLDVVPQGLKPGPYLQLLRQNGPTRTLKTVGRKVLGFDRKFNAALRSALESGSGSNSGSNSGSPSGSSSGSAGHPVDATYLQMDASRMTFPDNTFDLAYSFSVFEHLPDPDAVLQHIVRVLRPGGVLSISVHIYAAEGGCHDLRIFAGDRAGIPYWAQLRPAHRATVIESCYMNKWSLAQWRALFEQYCPGGEVSLEPHEQPFGGQLVEELAQIRAGGELDDYTDEELLTVNVRVVWQKPANQTAQAA
jgi:SAM-dependent methyltransferase